MKLLTLVCCLGVTVAACDGEPRLPVQASQVVTPPPPPPPPPPAPAQQLRLGEEVKATLSGHGTHMRYELTAPSDGVLVVRLTWDTTKGRLELMLEDRNFVEGSPTIGTLAVTAGVTYRVGVLDGAPWDYDDLVVPFVLATAMD